VVTEEEARKIDNPKIKEASKLNIETIQEDSIQDYIDSYVPPPDYSPYSAANESSHSSNYYGILLFFFLFLFLILILNIGEENGDQAHITVVSAVPSTAGMPFDILFSF
jgi:hypothetical protein